MVEVAKVIKQSFAELNEAGIGYVNDVESKGAGIVSETLSVFVLKTESGENMIVVGSMTPKEEGGFDIKGLVVHDSGKVVIGANQVFVQKKEFESHEDATNALEKGEEYYLAGDNNVYRRV